MAEEEKTTVDANLETELPKQSEVATKTAIKKKATTKKARKPNTKKAQAKPKSELEYASSRQEEAPSSESGCCGIQSCSSNMMIIGGLVVLLIIAAGAYFMVGTPSTATPTTTTTVAESSDPTAVAKTDDIVSISYTGTLENGSVFDTSDQNLAKKSGIYNPLRKYEPLTFTLGDKRIIPGFNDAIIGMKVGEEKTFTLPPEKAYGMPRPDLIDTIEKYQKSPIVQNVSYQKFVDDIGKEPVVDMEFNLENKTEYEISWPMRVMAVYNDTVTIKYMPNNNATITTVFGKANVYGTENEIIIKINPIKGQKIMTLSGPAKVVDENEQNVTLDFNSELAGKTLKFNVKLESILKQ